MNIYRAGEVVVGESYNEASKTWTNHDLSLWAGVDTSGRGVFAIRGDSGHEVVEVPILFEKKNIEHLKHLLTTAQEWARNVEKNRADAAKIIGCLPLDSWACNVPGVPEGAGQMGLTFWSTNNGQRSSLIIDLIDGNSRCCKRIQVYLAAAKISSMIYNLKQLDSAMKKAKGNFKKQHLLTNPRKTPSAP